MDGFISFEYKNFTDRYHTLGPVFKHGPNKLTFIFLVFITSVHLFIKDTKGLNSCFGRIRRHGREEKKTGRIQGV